VRFKPRYERAWFFEGVPGKLERKIRASNNTRANAGWKTRRHSTPVYPKMPRGTAIDSYEYRITSMPVCRHRRHSSIPARIHRARMPGMTQSIHRNALKTGYALHWYRIENVLGRGGFGITYLARDLNLHQQVAIKEYLPTGFAVREQDLSVHPAAGNHAEPFAWGLARFIDEARTLTRFRHPNIVRVRAVFEANGTGYMVMEYEQGENLKDILDRRRTLNQDELLKILLPILDGLETVHEHGFIHRDINPANIIIRADGSPVLIDFGSARQALGAESYTLTTVVTRGFAPFEQYSGKSQGPWTDIYGLGATLYRAVTGNEPQDAMRRSAAIMDSEPDPLDDIRNFGQGRYSRHFLSAIDHALQFRESDRPQTVAEWRPQFHIPSDAVPQPCRPQTDAAIGNGSIANPLAIKATPRRDSDDKAITGLNIPANRSHETVRLATNRSALAAVISKGIAPALRKGKTKALTVAVPGSILIVIVWMLAVFLPEPAVVENPTPIADAAADFERLALTGEFVDIPAGTFLMGCSRGDADCDGDELPAHKVSVKGFRMGKTEVTVGQFRRFAEATGYRTDSKRERGCVTVRPDGKWAEQSGRTWKNPGFRQTERHPVVCVSWTDAKAYVRWLSKQGLGVFRLPSESEWEYAARAGEGARYSFGDSQKNLCSYGNIADNTAGGRFPKWITGSCNDRALYPAAAGRYHANRFGLHDLHGNVWEWTEDCYHDSYSRAPASQSPWTAGGCTRRLLRGGSWADGPRLARSSNRLSGRPGSRSDVVGFRIVHDP
jgi:formylglycine-generating enzyme required for sulfatase activity